MNNKEEISPYKGKNHLEEDSKKVVEFNELLKEIREEKPNSVIDSLRKVYSYSKKIKKSKIPSDILWFILLKYSVGKYYTDDFLLENDEINSDFFWNKKNNQVVRFEWKKNSFIRTTVINNNKDDEHNEVISSAVKKRLLSKHFKYKVQIVSRKPLIYGTLESSLKSHYIKVGIKHDSRKIVKRINKLLIFAKEKSLEDLKKADVYNYKVIDLRETKNS
ncbi:hypothetical protein [Spiroplasma endosymbiont of Aspidapion aeneum]|uniref:hypothetical protein n=1 Tax=Spiroplasma endosymbiont of Aspidapion aeneum TaxID=3066276 RepID=UPI00313CD467